MDGGKQWCTYSVVVCHSPCDRQESEQEAESWGAPAGVGMNLSKDIFRRVLFLLEDEEGNTTSEQYGYVNDSVSPGYLGQPGCV